MLQYFALKKARENCRAFDSYKIAAIALLTNGLTLLIICDPRWGLNAGPMIASIITLGLLFLLGNQKSVFAYRLLLIINALNFIPILGIPPHSTPVATLYLVLIIGLNMFAGFLLSRSFLHHYRTEHTGALPLKSMGGTIGYLLGFSCRPAFLKPAEKTTWRLFGETPTISIACFILGCIFVVNAITDTAEINWAISASQVEDYVMAWMNSTLSVWHLGTHPIEYIGASIGENPLRAGFFLVVFTIITVGGYNVFVRFGKREKSVL